MEKQHTITVQLAGIAGILFTILISMVAFRFFVLPQGQADLATIEVPITPPYLRLVSDQSIDDQGNLGVDVYANTSGQPIIGADVVVEYNPEIIQYVDNSLEKSQYFSAVQKNSQNSSRLNFSVFNNQGLGDSPVQTNADQEVKVASLLFHIINQEADLAQIQLQFAEGQLEDSNLILYQQPRAESSQDILRNVQGVILSLP